MTQRSRKSFLRRSTLLWKVLDRRWGIERKLAFAVVLAALVRASSPFSHGLERRTSARTRIPSLSFSTLTASCCCCWGDRCPPAHARLGGASPRSGRLRPACPDRHSVQPRGGHAGDPRRGILGAVPKFWHSGMVQRAGAHRRRVVKRRRESVSGRAPAEHPRRGVRNGQRSQPRGCTLMRNPELFEQLLAAQGGTGLSPRRLWIDGNGRDSSRRRSA